MKTTSVLLFLFFTTALGCAAPSDDDPDVGDDVDSAESAVKTRNCPASFALEISDFRATPNVVRSDVLAIQSQFANAGTITVKAEIDSRKNGVCTYRDPATGRSMPRIKLYSKSGKDILQLGVDVDANPYTDRHRVYAFPSSYNASGFAFTNDRVIVDGVIGQPDGPNMIFKVGTAQIAASP
jgi:hypothetical protein